MQIPVKIVQPQPVTDRLSRPLRELRLSVIDRCNFRCTYCMPADSLNGQGVFLPLDRLLTDHEIERLVSRFVELGVRKVRITGGEPLLRPGLPGLVERLARLPQLEDIALTTNGVLLPRLAEDLADAGLGRITVSLDTLNPEVLSTMSGGRAELGKILEGIEAAEQAGFHSLKINTVVQRGVNDHTIMDLLAHFRGTPHTVRLIEFMDVGNCNHWNRSEVIPSAEWIQRIDAKWPIEPLSAVSSAETAQRYRYRDGSGEIGFISSITQPFCGGCSRARLTADGVFYTCLFAGKGTHLMPLLRQSGHPGDLRTTISRIWQQRDDRYSEERGLPGHDQEKVEMYRMGG